MQDRPFLCKKLGLINLGGRTLAATGSVRSEHWKRTPNPPEHSAKAPPSLELTCERRTVPAEPRRGTHPQRQPRHLATPKICETGPFCVNRWDRPRQGGFQCLRGLWGEGVVLFRARTHERLALRQTGPASHRILLRTKGGREHLDRPSRYSGCDGCGTDPRNSGRRCHSDCGDAPFADPPRGSDRNR